MLFHHNLLDHFAVLGQIDIIPHLDKVLEDHLNIHNKIYPSTSI